MDNGIRWHTFAGGRINRLLAAALTETTQRPWTAGNLSHKCSDVAPATAHQAVRNLRELDWASLCPKAAPELTKARISKLQPCLPERAEKALLVDRSLDVGGTMAFLEDTDVPVAY